jgi:hypothetical protein
MRVPSTSRPTSRKTSPRSFPAAAALRARVRGEVPVRRALPRAPVPPPDGAACGPPRPGAPLGRGASRKGLAWAHARSRHGRRRPVTTSRAPRGRSFEHRDQFPAAATPCACLRRVPCPACASRGPVPPPAVAARGPLPAGAPLGGGASRTELAWEDVLSCRSRQGRGGRYLAGFQPPFRLARVCGEFPVRPAPVAGRSRHRRSRPEGRFRRVLPLCGGALRTEFAWGDALSHPLTSWPAAAGLRATPHRAPAARPARHRRSPCSVPS